MRVYYEQLLLLLSIVLYYVLANLFYPETVRRRGKKILDPVANKFQGQNIFVPLLHNNRSIRFISPIFKGLNPK